jgi:hypothetical protein
MVEAFSILAALAIIFAAVVIFDRVFFKKKTKSVRVGMTGMEIQELTGLKLKIKEIKPGGQYSAEVRSLLKFFKIRYNFEKGRLKEILR